VVCVSSVPEIDYARRVHRDAVTVDLYHDNIFRIRNLREDLATADHPGFFDLVKCANGNLDASFWSCTVMPNSCPEGEERQELEAMLDAIERFCEANDGRIALATSTDEIRHLNGKGVHSALLCVEGSVAIGKDLSYLGTLAQRGIKYLGLTHVETTLWADSCTGARSYGGLSGLGREAVQELNRLGIAIDLSHSSDEVFWQVLGLSRQPVLCSHSASRTLNNAPRNLSDEMLRALDANKALVGVNAFPSSLSKRFSDELRASAAAEDADLATGNVAGKLVRSASHDPRQQYEVLVRRNLAMPTLDDLVEQITWMAQHCHTSRLAVGSGHGMMQYGLVGMEDCTRLPALTHALMKRGFDEAATRGIIGDNVMDFFDRMERLPR
jgi:membrane dipeptidase